MTKTEQNELARLHREQVGLTGKLKVATNEMERHLNKALANNGTLTPKETAARDTTKANADVIRAEMDDNAKAIADVRSGAWRQEQARLAKNPKARAELATLTVQVPKVKAEIAMMAGRLATLAMIESASQNPLSKGQAENRIEYARRHRAAVAQLETIKRRMLALRKG